MTKLNIQIRGKLHSNFRVFKEGLGASRKRKKPATLNFKAAGFVCVT